MVSVKSQRELDLMRQSGKLTAQVLQEVVKAAKPGVQLIELDALAEKLTVDAGAIPAFKGYSGYRHTLCTSVNDRVVHGIPSKYALKEGDIVGLDFGLKLNGYFGDSAVTVPIGKIPDNVRTLLEVTQQSLYAGIDAARAGNTVKDIAAAVAGVAKTKRYGIVREFVGHGIGQKLHEDPQIPNYPEAASTMKLKPGMTLAIEPMINEGGHEVKVLEDRWTAVTVDKSLSAHFEHTIVVTEGDPEILTEWSGGRYMVGAN